MCTSVCSVCQNRIQNVVLFALRLTSHFNPDTCFTLIGGTTDDKFIHYQQLQPSHCEKTNEIEQQAKEKRGACPAADACDNFSVVLKPLPARSLCTPECRRALTDKQKNAHTHIRMCSGACSQMCRCCTCIGKHTC